MSQEGSADYGFVEIAPVWKLESRFFPSKVGGKPAWLDLKNLPSPEELKCGNCAEPCIFLCQVYCPITELDYCFHRTIFIFLCANPKCCLPNSNHNFKVFRCQIGRVNDFYSNEPPVEEENWQNDVKVERFCKICFVCGSKSTSHCGQCKTTNYCSKSHQVLDWKSGHKEWCVKGNDNRSSIPSILLPQYELQIEPEEISCDEDSSDSSGDEAANLEESKSENMKTAFQDDPSVDEDLLQMAAVENADDSIFLKFKSRTAGKQVLRYDRGGKPIWISSTRPPVILPCEQCGKSRQFEFQILPQMLSHLHLDSVEHTIDWGTLAVFTCQDSCGQGPAYKPEFLWKQDIV